MDFRPPSRPARREVHRAEQGFHGKKPHDRGQSAQDRDPLVGPDLVLDRRAQPHVPGRVSVQPIPNPCSRGLIRDQRSRRLKPRPEIRGTLRQQLPIQKRRFHDQDQQIGEPLRRNLGIEPITQTRTEHLWPVSAHHGSGPGGFLPGSRPVPRPRLGPGRGPVSRRPSPPMNSPAETLIARLGVTVGATRADSGAAQPGVKSVFRPLNAGIFHGNTSIFWLTIRFRDLVFTGALFPRMSPI